MLVEESTAREIRFSILKNEKISQGTVVYYNSQYSFDFEPKVEGGITSILINDLQIELDFDGILLYVWGYAPNSKFIEFAQGCIVLLFANNEILSLWLQPKFRD